MEQQKAFEIIKEVFTKSFNSFDRDQIETEGDWEGQLYGLFCDAIGEDIFSKYLLLVEHNSAKHDGKNLLWIGPNKYGKKKGLIEEFFNVTKDEATPPHIKLELNKNKKVLSSEIKALIDAEKKRAYYVDLILVRRSDLKRIFMIELKFGKDLDEQSVKEDLCKLRRIESVKNVNAIYIAVGFNKSNKKIYWEPTDKKYDHTFKLNSKAINSTTNNIHEPSEKDIADIIKRTPKDVYENFMWAKEMLWSCETRHQLSKILPVNWRCNSEIRGIFESNRETLDLAIYNNNKIEYAIELKGHYEGGIPMEIKQGMTKDKGIEKEFMDKSEEFFKNYKSLKSKLSQYPKRDGRDFINSDFFDKIIEMYDQCKRLSKLEKDNKIRKGYMVFIDHQDDFSIRKRKPNISEDEFLDNFTYRKNLIRKLLSSVIGNVELIYFYGLNVKNNKKKMFLLEN